MVPGPARWHTPPRRGKGAFDVAAAGGDVVYSPAAAYRHATLLDIGDHEPLRASWQRVVDSVRQRMNAILGFEVLPPDWPNHGQPTDPSHDQPDDEEAES